MAKPENSHVSEDDLLSALGIAQGAKAPSAVTTKKKESSSELNDDMLLDIFAPASKGSQSRSSSTSRRAASPEVSREREAQLKEKSIRSRQWKEELEKKQAADSGSARSASSAEPESAKRQSAQASEKTGSRPSGVSEGDAARRSRKDAASKGTEIITVKAKPVIIEDSPSKDARDSEDVKDIRESRRSRGLPDSRESSSDQRDMRDAKSTWEPRNARATRPSTARGASGDIPQRPRTSTNPWIAPDDAPKRQGPYQSQSQYGTSRQDMRPRGEGDFRQQPVSQPGPDARGRSDMRGQGAWPAPDPAMRQRYENQQVSQQRQYPQQQYGSPQPSQQYPPERYRSQPQGYPQDQMARPMQQPSHMYPQNQQPSEQMPMQAPDDDDRIRETGPWENPLGVVLIVLAVLCVLIAASLLTGLWDISNL